MSTRGHRLKIALDSGAHSLYNKHHLGKPGTLQAEFYKTKEFKKYLEQYIATLHRYGDQLWMYVTLDVIHNAQATWDILQYMESCGLHPLPVFHAKSDTKWLFKLLDKYDYFCIGGFGGMLHSSSDYTPFGDYIFKQICDSNGMPKSRIHGLAMTGKLAARWPWYSIDSITWRYNAAMGHIAIPLMHRGELILERVVMTDRRVDQPGHYMSHAPVLQRKVDEIFQTCGYTYQDVRTSHHVRGVLGAYLFANMVKMIRGNWKQRLPDFKGWRLLYAGDPLTNGQNRIIFAEILEKELVDSVIVFETFWTSFIGKDTKKGRSLTKQYFKSKATKG